MMSSFQKKKYILEQCQGNPYHMIPLLPHYIPIFFLEWEARVELLPACWEMSVTCSLSYGCLGAHPWECVMHVNLICHICYLMEGG